MLKYIAFFLTILGLVIPSQGQIFVWDQERDLQCDQVCTRIDSLYKNGNTLMARDLCAYLYIEASKREDPCKEKVHSRIIKMDSEMATSQLWELLVNERCDGPAYPICTHYGISIAIKAFIEGDESKAWQALNWINIGYEELKTEKLNTKRKVLLSIFKQHPELIGKRIN